MLPAGARTKHAALSTKHEHPAPSTRHQAHRTWTCVSDSDSVSYCEMKIAVVGTGYVGLVVGACLAENGNNVVCVDKDAATAHTLAAGKMPISGPGLEVIVRRQHGEERLHFTNDLPAAVRASEIVFIA